MTDKKIIPQIDKKIAKKADEFAEREYETSGYERQWLSKGYYHGFMDANKGKLEEPVSEDLNTVAKEYANNITEKIGYRLQLRRAVCFGAEWHKEQLIVNAVDATVHIDDGGYPYISQMELYDYDNDIPLAKEGDKYKVILIKE